MPKPMQAATRLARPDGGAVAREPCGSDLADIYEIAAVLEPVAAARAASRASEADLQQAAGLLAAMRAETDVFRWAEHNSSFHAVIDQAGGGPRMAAILTDLRNRSAGYIRNTLVSVPGRAVAATAEHEQILRAIIAGDAAAVADAVRRHMIATLYAVRACHELPPGGLAEPAEVPLP